MNGHDTMLEREQIEKLHRLVVAADTFRDEWSRTLGQVEEESLAEEIALKISQEADKYALAELRRFALSLLEMARMCLRLQEENVRLQIRLQRLEQESKEIGKRYGDY